LGDGQHLDRNGMTVPLPIPTMDGRMFVNGLLVMRYRKGGPPETEGDERRVADTLRQLAPAYAGLAAASGLTILYRPAAS
jgi:Ser/Thr protein kinase RdoA (MazF antagonist)